MTTQVTHHEPTLTETSNPLVGISFRVVAPVTIVEDDGFTEDQNTEFEVSFMGGQAWMQLNGWPNATRVTNPERFGPVPTDIVSKANREVGRKWVYRFAMADEG